MASVTENQKKLKDKLSEMFQFDQADLDFGIYRIMNYKREEIKRFLEKDLLAQTSEQLSVLTGSKNEAAIAELDKRIADTKAGPLSESLKNAAIAELEEKKRALADAVDITEVEADIYSHLTEFFSRYYDEGDFISQRRYKDGVYAIPYEGEEVKLHWANADQYYVKTSEYFKNYTFKTGYGQTVHFRIVEAETEKDNNKGKNRFFQLYKENPFVLENNELIIHFEYKEGDKKKQEQYNEEVIAAFAAVADKYPDFASLLTVSDGKTLLERQLNRYTARNTFDYFIHKDLGKFLRRELDFYIKNDVVFLDDIDTQDENQTRAYLTKAKVIRDIGRKIIDFLAQIEDFQKKLWLKKKFVVETNYCITLDRVPKALYPQIIANKAQIEEWVRLFAIDEITETPGSLIEGGKVGFSDPLTIEFLEQNPYLVLDTAFFPAEFKEQLIDSIDGLDENLDGLLIHSENFQALNLLQERYRKQIKCAYIDPPYNAKSSEILYKNNYKNSSWLSLMYDRIQAETALLTDDFVHFTAIDEIEQEILGQTISSIFPNCKKVCLSIVHNPRGQQGKNVSYTHEFAYMVYPSDEKKYISDMRREEVDSRTLRDSGTESDRKDAATCFYPFFVKDNKIIGIGEVPPDDYHPSSSNVRRKDGTIEIWPIDDNGNEKKWRYSVSSVSAIMSKLRVKQGRESLQIIFDQDMGVMKSLWSDAKYDASEYGTKVLQALLGVDQTPPNLYPKSINNVRDCLFAGLNGNKTAVIIDYFAGSGTTAHAVINLNREDGGKRKYILVEMGEYFDTVTKPRIQKVIYSEDWKDGKPVSRKGSSHAFKYLRLESYEDTLNNIRFEEAGLPDLITNSAVREQYILSYMLPNETKGSPSLLNIDMLEHPFNYAMSITRRQESKPTNIDLVETFNYLIGLQVERSYAMQSFDAEFVTGEHGAIAAKLKSGNTYTFKMVEGKTLSGDRTLVIWRDLTGDKIKDNAVLDAFFERKKINTTDFEYKKIYVNGDNNLPNLRTDDENWKVILIEEEMKKRMFQEA